MDVPERIVVRGETLGNRSLTEKEGAPGFTEADAEALETLAAQAAITIENARLYAQAERVSVLEDRLNAAIADLRSDVLGLRPVTAFYVAADALGNVGRHARARHAAVHLSIEDDQVVLQISDDGVGFDFDATSTGRGLYNMRERAFAVEGTLRVERAPDRGSKVPLELPAQRAGGAA